MNVRSYREHRRRTDGHRDSLGVRHTVSPIIARSGRGYGSIHAAHYLCGCSPAVHRFKCGYCGDVVGWCFGAADEEPDACDDCWTEIHMEQRA